MNRCFSSAALLWLIVACLAQAGDDLQPAEKTPFLDVLEPGQTVLVARFPFGFELVIVDGAQSADADAHVVSEVGEDYVVLRQGDWEKRIAAQAIAVIGRKKPQLETAARRDDPGGASVLRADRRQIQGRWRIASARVSGREVELPDEVVWTFSGDSFLSGGYFPAAVEGQRDAGREQFELAEPGTETELAHVAFSLPRENAGEDRAAKPQFHAAEPDISPSRPPRDAVSTDKEDAKLNVLRITVTLENGGLRKLEGVYFLSGDTLTVCLGAERSATRLHTAPDDGLMLFILERLPAA